jgi:hypothetical protein
MLKVHGALKNGTRAVPFNFLRNDGLAHAALR